MPQLTQVPDLQDWSALADWLASRTAMLASLSPAAVRADSLMSLSVGNPGASAGTCRERCELGAYADESWRKHVVAILLADWSAYPEAVDRVSLARLQYVMQTFPQGFRSWWVETHEVGWLPIGYSGWHPISANAFQLLRQAPGSIVDRGELTPLSRLAPQPYLYIFNYSMAPSFRRAPWTTTLLKTLAAELEATQYRGLCAITVSEAGARVAQRFGMTQSGSCVIDGAVEAAFSMELDPLALPALRLRLP